DRTSCPVFAVLQSAHFRLVSQEAPITIDPTNAARHNLKGFPSQGDRLDASDHEYCYGKFDIVIVGGGTAGLAAATAFADIARPDSNCLLLEANPTQLGGRAMRSVAIDQINTVNTCAWFATASPESSELTYLLNNNRKINSNTKFRWESLTADDTGFFFGTSPVSRDMVDACFAFHQACVVGAFLLPCEDDAFLPVYDKFRSHYLSMVRDGTVKEKQFIIFVTEKTSDGKSKTPEAEAVLDYMRASEFTHTGAPELSRAVVESEYLTRKIIMNMKNVAKEEAGGSPKAIDFTFRDILTVVASLRGLDPGQLATFVAKGLDEKELSDDTPEDLVATIRDWVQFAKDDKKGRGRPREYGGFIYDGRQIGWGVMMSEVVNMVKNHQSRLEVICGARVRKIDGPHGVNQWTSVVWFTLPGRGTNVRFVLCKNVIICLPLPVVQRADPISVLPSPMGATALQISGIPDDELIRLRESLSRLWAGFDERLVYAFKVAPWNQGERTPFPEEWKSPGCESWDDLPVFKIASTSCLRFVNVTKYFPRAFQFKAILVACISSAAPRNPQDWHTFVKVALTSLFKGCTTIPDPYGKHLVTDNLIQTAFCKILPGFSENLHSLGKPLGSFKGALRLAGEYTSIKAFGTVDGAWQSGREHAVEIIKEHVEDQASLAAESSANETEADLLKSGEDASSLGQSSVPASAGDDGRDSCLPRIVIQPTLRDIENFSYGFRYVKRAPEFDLVCPARKNVRQAQLDREVVEAWVKRVQPTYQDLNKFINALVEESAKGRNSDICGLADFYARAVLKSRQTIVQPWELSDYPDPGT
ncbi:hypothetical protein FOZ62_031882, partial [Perkinsus olseni]